MIAASAGPRLAPRLQQRAGIFAAILAGFVFLHATSILLFPARAGALSYAFTSLATLAATAACLRQSLRSHERAHFFWLLVTLGLMLWTVGMLLAAHEELIQHAPSSISSFSDFVYFLYGAPLLLALSLPLDIQKSRAFLALDGVQVVIAAYLAYVTIFAATPLFGEVSIPMPIPLLTLTFNIENVVLAASALIRIAADRRRGAPVFAVLFRYLLLYALCAGAYNAYVGSGTTHGVIDGLIDIPFLWLALELTLFPPAARPETSLLAASEITVAAGRLSLYVDAGCRFFYTMALAVLAATVIRHHYWSGLITMGLILMIYGARTTVTQIRYLVSQNALRVANLRLAELSLTDDLTSLPNRRSFDEALQRAWTSCVPAGQPVSLLMIDIDHFKSFNDRHGHQQGDICLTRIAQALQSALSRSTDCVARYGGEEFAAILPNTDATGAHAIASRMQQAVRALQIAHATPCGPHASISVGIATTRPVQPGSAASLIEAADSALYEAKRKGRNRIICPVLDAA